MYYFKGTVPIPPLGMVDDLFTISVCGYKTNLMNKFINTKTAMKKLQFGTSKCVKMHVGKTLGWAKNTKVVQSFSASILCEGHMYKDIGK